MKILCVSDQIDPLVYSSLAKERFADIDVVLCAGDLPSDYIDFIVSTLNKPAFFIFGNHNLTEFSYYHKAPKRQKGSHPTWEKEYSIYDMSANFGAVYAGFRNLRDKSTCDCFYSRCYVKNFIIQGHQNDLFLSV